MTRVLVTGGTGFIGARVTDALRHAGHDACAGTRRAAPQAGVIACDLDRPAEIASALAGVETVVHCAYGEESAMPRQCATLLAAMATTGVTRLVYFSSIAVHGDGQGPLDGYGRAKMDCETLVRDWEKASAERRAIILRPGIVYGAGSRFWIDKMAERIRLGIWGDFGPAGDGWAHLVHVDDVAALTVAAVDRLHDGAATGEIPPLEIVGPDRPDWNAYFQSLAAALGTPALPVIGPTRLRWWATQRLAAKIWRRIGLPGGHRAALAPAPGELALFRRRLALDAGAATAFLGLAPKITLKEGLARSVGPQDTSPEP